MFQAPGDIINEQDSYSSREIGLTHPDVAGFIRICDSGNIEIIAGEGVSLVLNPTNRSITLVADTIKFLTRHEGGLRWNRILFNEKANRFNEPTFINFDDKSEGSSLYQGVDYYSIPEDEEPTSEGIMIKDELGAEVLLKDYLKKFKEGGGGDV